MTATATPLPLRNDTILGVCEAIGQDFGFNANWLRVAFVAPIFYSPMLCIAAYLGLGVVVAITRWVAPNTNTDTPHIVSSHPLVKAKSESDELAIAA